MPDPKKVSWAQLRIGIMAAVAMGILAVLIFLLTGSGGIFTKHATIRTYMDDSAAMAKGSPVRLNGIAIGSIESIDFSGSKEKGKIVVIVMKIKKDLLPQIPDNSMAEVTAANLLGDKFINITKGNSPNYIRDGGTLQAKEGQDIPELMSRAGDILGGFNVTLKRLDTIMAGIEKGEGNIGKLLKDEDLYNKLTATATELQKIVAQVNTGKGTLGRLLKDETLYEEIRTPIKRVDDILAEIQQGQGTAGKLLKDSALYDETRQTIADLRKLVDTDIRKVVEDLNAGKGTAGKFLKDEELYRQINRLVAKLDSTVDRVNSGQGTLGQLLVNPQLYESLNGATREAQALVKDIRANPKKFLRIKLAIF